VTYFLTNGELTNLLSSGIGVNFGHMENEVVLLIALSSSHRNFRFASVLSVLQYNVPNNVVDILS
jgi:hypothetical protein